jgi:isoquinoline 1-oxidoreductase beta subunit
MGRARTIARRSFLVGSAAILGGVAFGVYAYRSDVPNPLLEDLGPGEAAFNPFVKVTGEGITLITPRADVGQGAISVQAHLIAEELDVDPAQVTLDYGPPAKAYYNHVVAAEGMPIAATSDGLAAQTGRTAADFLAKVMGLQLTGGSTTVPDMYDRLREAGAMARETLVRAAMERTGLSRSELRTENGAVFLPDGGRLAYTELAAAAAQIDPPRDVPLRDPSEWRSLGKPHRRVDIVAKSTGAQTYGIDLAMEGMLYATTRTNPALGGGMKGYDAAAAETMRGVEAVIPITGGVAVVADNTWRAFRAAETIDVDWGPSPYIGDTEAMFAAAENAMTAEHQDSQFKDLGDIDEALREGEPVEAAYRLPYLAHAPLEPMNAVVMLKDDRLDIWTGTQIPRFMQAQAAAIAGLAAERVHVHVQSSGGSFGRRLEDDYVRQAVEIAVAMPGVPIKMTWSREEDFTHDFPRPLAAAKAIGAVKDGQVTAFDLSIAAPSVTESSLQRLGQPALGPDVAIVAGAWDQPFAIPNYQVTGYRVPAMVPVSSWRSVGASGNGFLHETFLDELCHAAGADPLEERLRLVDDTASRKVLEAIGELSDWGSPLGEGQGRGIAFTLSFGVPVAEVVEVTQTDRGIRLDRAFVVADVGRVLDPVNIEAQLSGGLIFGLGHAMNCELTYSGGVPEQDNYHLYEGLRLHQTPRIEVRALEYGSRIKGVGEPAVPPAAPALGNAIFAATSQRIRRLPFYNEVSFL